MERGRERESGGVWMVIGQMMKWRVTFDDIVTHHVAGLLGAAGDQLLAIRRHAARVRVAQGVRPRDGGQPRRAAALALLEERNLRRHVLHGLPESRAVVCPQRHGTEYLEMDFIKYLYFLSTTNAGSARRQRQP
jgi:hypothetical protein